MVKTQTIDIPENRACKIDAGIAGLTIEGPAVIVILENIKELGEDRNTQFSANN